MINDLFTAGQTAGARQVLKQSPTWVSKNIAKQHLTEDGGGVSNQRRETPGFLAERGFLIRLIPVGGRNSVGSKLYASL